MNETPTPPPAPSAPQTPRTDAALKRLAVLEQGEMTYVTLEAKYRVREFMQKELSPIELESAARHRVIDAIELECKSDLGHELIVYHILAIIADWKGEAV